MRDAGLPMHRRPNSATDVVLSAELQQRRLKWLFWAFVAGLFTVYGRLIAVQWTDGAEYRAAAAEPLRRVRSIAAPRGRILARDGTVLAEDRPEVDLALNYRWLQEPADPRWLRSMARARLTARQRRDPQELARQSGAVLEQRQQLWRRIAILCNLTDEQWQARLQRIQRKVETMASNVAARQQAAAVKHDRQASEASWQDSTTSSVATLVGQSLLEALFADDDSPANTHLTIAEEVSEHVVVEGLSLEAVAEIEAHPQQYSGVELLHSFRREYPQQNLAAHLVGYIGAPNARDLAANPTVGSAQKAKESILDDRIGRAGIERQYETILRGRPGMIVDEIDLRGRMIASNTIQEADAGQNLISTLDPALERSAETLLDSAVARRIATNGGFSDPGSGGAVVVMDIRDGAILAAASAPRFDPNVFIEHGNQEIRQWFNDSNRPMFDRTVQMALPPGSVFKIIAAAALLDSGVNPAAPVDCEGYLHQPDALRCAIYRRLGVGHGPVTMVDALARSCNVYFFHYAEQLGSMPLVNWGRRFGLGAASGIDLPGEVAGSFPAVVEDTVRPTGSDPRLIAIGQGPVTVTPLQMARVIAAIANGGNLVKPHFVERICSPLEPFDRSTVNADLGIPLRVAGLNPQMLAVIRKGLRQAVANDEGTAHATVDFSDVAIAGKTGTAEVGARQPEHSWFAGYAPADQPQVAFVVVLEHAGEASTAAGPVVARLVSRMNELGYFSKSHLANNHNH